MLPCKQATCLIEITKEIESANNSAGTTSTAAAASCQSEKGPSEDKSVSPISEKESKPTAEGSADKNDSHKEASDQGATA